MLSTYRAGAMRSPTRMAGDLEAIENTRCHCCGEAKPSLRHFFCDCPGHGGDGDAGGALGFLGFLVIPAVIAACVIKGTMANQQEQELPTQGGRVPQPVLPQRVQTAQRLAAHPAAQEGLELLGRDAATLVAALDAHDLEQGPPVEAVRLQRLEPRLLRHRYFSITSKHTIIAYSGRC